MDALIAIASAGRIGHCTAMKLLRSARRALFPLLTLLTTACAGGQPALAPAAGARQPADWAFETSDVPVDPAYRFGKLANGMRFVIRHNATPAGTGIVRMEIAAGSLDETDAERGFAHFVEHMAFNGSTRVPEGEMVRLLERNGLAFGADTNATTSFDRTTYMLDLPRNDPALLDTALMLMRETASELTISPEAVARERGVVLAEMRDRNSWSLRNLEDQIAFANPGSLYARRLPIGTAETVGAASADALKAFWRREYVPAQATLIVIGDFDADAVEAAIRQHFDSWPATPAGPRPSAGPILPKDKGRTDIYLDPALSERVTAFRNGPRLDEPDTVAQRQENLLRQVAYGVINRRLLRIARQPDPPFRSAGFGTGDIFRDGRVTNLIIDSVDSRWRRGLLAAATEYRRALRHGFTAAEVAEQVANIRATWENAALSAQTRSHGALADAVFALLREDIVPSTPESALARLEAFLPRITPEASLAALKREALPLKQPLIRLQGRKSVPGGEAALRSAWNEAMRLPLPTPPQTGAAAFAYTRFGDPGAVVTDTREPALGIRTLRFANGVRLNLRPTTLDLGKVQVRLTLDGGNRLNTRDNPTATEMTSYLPSGGLGKHSQDEVQSLLAGTTAGVELNSTYDGFVIARQTARRDLERQLQLMAALVTDPGYRPEGEVQYRLNINNFFAQLRATPNAALGNAIGGILSDDDPRFTLLAPDVYRKLTFPKLRADISGTLAKGAIEIALVGDFDEAEAIALVASTFGALPPREPDFRVWSEQRQRPFTANLAPRVLRHTGPKDQALLRLTWKTRDDSDPQETAVLELLERVVRIELTETLREKLGKAYSPSAASNPSHYWDGYGTFGIAASVDVAEVPATREAIREALAGLRASPVSDDELQRARQPLLEGWDNALKTNTGWMSLVARAQGEPQRIARHLAARDRMAAITPAQVQDAARRYLADGGALEILVLPEGVEPPKP